MLKLADADHFINIQNLQMIGCVSLVSSTKVEGAGCFLIIQFG